MGNKGSKGVGGKSARPPVKSDNRGFKFGNLNASGRDAGKSAPAAPSSNAPYGAPAAPSQSAPPAPPSKGDDNDCKCVLLIWI